VTVVDVILIALAINCVVHCWFRADLFADWRATIESWTAADVRPEFRGGKLEFLHDLLLCPYCISFWVGLAVALLWWIAYPVVFVLAAIRLAWILNSCLPKDQQYE
jgi:hypothetical protein